MAKRSNNRSKNEDVKEFMFTNSKGITVKLTGVPPLVIPMIADSIDYPEKPTYSIETVTGDVEIHEHDETTLATDEDKEVWAKYQLAYENAEEELTAKMLNAILIEGVFVEEITSAERWIKRQQLMGIPVSDDEEERLLHYKQSEIARSSSDIEFIMDKVMELTGVNPEDLALARSSFQDPVEPEPQAGEGEGS